MQATFLFSANIHLFNPHNETVEGVNDHIHLTDEDLGHCLAAILKRDPWL